MGRNPFQGFCACPFQKDPEIFKNFLPVNFPEQRSSSESFGFSFRKDSVGNLNQNLLVTLDLIEPKRAGDLLYGLPAEVEEEIMNDPASFQGLDAQNFLGRGEKP
jgi:hypothetical protein